MSVYISGTISIATGETIAVLTGGTVSEINMKIGDRFETGGSAPNAIIALDVNANSFELANPLDGAGGSALSYVIYHMPTGWGDRVALAEQTATEIRLLGGGILTRANYALRAELFADLLHSENGLGKVFDDPTAGYVGLYKKTGAYGGGSWTRIGDLPELDQATQSAEDAIAARDITLSAKDTALVAQTATAADVISTNAAATQTALDAAQTSADVAATATIAVTLVQMATAFTNSQTRYVEAHAFS